MSAPTLARHQQPVKKSVFLRCCCCIVLQYSSLRRLTRRLSSSQPGRSPNCEYIILCDRYGGDSPRAWLVPRLVGCQFSWLRQLLRRVNLALPSCALASLHVLIGTTHALATTTTTSVAADAAAAAAAACCCFNYGCRWVLWLRLCELITLQVHTPSQVRKDIKLYTLALASAHN